MAPARATARIPRAVPSFSVTSTEPLSSISLPNRAPSRKSGKNCARNFAAPPMKVSVQWARSGSPDAAVATSAAAGANSSTLSRDKTARWETLVRRECREVPRASASNVVEHRVEVERRARAEIVAVRREEGFRRAAPLVAQHDKEIPFGIELRGIAELGHGGARDAMDAHPGPAGALAVAGV